jgi:hypothetical protein
MGKRFERSTTPSTTLSYSRLSTTRRVQAVQDWPPYMKAP